MQVSSFLVLRMKASFWKTSPSRHRPAGQRLGEAYNVPSLDHTCAYGAMYKTDETNQINRRDQINQTNEIDETNGTNEINQIDETNQTNQTDQTDQMDEIRDNFQRRPLRLIRLRYQRG